MRLLPADRSGRPLFIGTRVRVCAIPNLTGMSPDTIKETTAVFRFAVGRYFIVTGFDELGYASLDITIPLGKNRGLHTIWIEPWLLKKSNRQPFKQTR